MTSLAEAYEGTVGVEVSPRRLYLGLGLFLSGALLTAVGVVVASTDLLVATGLVTDRMAAWRRAGVLAGLGVPAVMGGVFVVLPSSRRIKAAATIGASVSLLGVALFWYAYPAHWAGYGRELTLPVTSVYFFGTATSVWCLFVGLVNFKRRNDPGGTVSLRVTKGGETKVVEVPRSELQSKGVGGVGMFGSDPDGDVETQTGGFSGPATASSSGSSGQSGSQSGSKSTTTATASASAGRSGSSGSKSTGGPKSGGSKADGSIDEVGSSAGGSGGKAQSRQRPQNPRAAKAELRETEAAGAASDGGLEDDEITSLNAEGEVITPGESAKDLADRYCGNCEYFRYVRSEDGMQPYCGFHGETMGDMESCEEWEPNH